MININNLTKDYGNNLALDNVSFNVEKGEILGFLGPNGAGKSTTMNIITGYLSATDGTVTVNGLDNVQDSLKCRKMIGYLPEIPPLYNDMTVYEYLSFVYDIKKAQQPKKQHIDDILNDVDIKNVSHKLIKNLSKGYKQRVGIAQALIGDPEILILDEPTVGLDPKQINEIRNVIKKLKQHHTIILSTHILPEVSAVCDRVVIINRGKIIAEDSISNLSKKIGKNNYTARVVGDKTLIKSIISSVQGILSIEYQGTYEQDANDYIIQTDDNINTRVELFNVLHQNNMPLIMLKSNEASLEEIYIELINQSNTKKGGNRR